MYRICPVCDRAIFLPQDSSGVLLAHKVLKVSYCDRSMSVICQCVFHCAFNDYKEDIYSVAVNTTNIFIECNENINIFMSAKHE